MAIDNAVPFVDLLTPHLQLEDEFTEVFRKTLKTGRFIGGPMVEGFEADFAGYCNTRYCIGVGSGTDALRFALIASGIKTGDIVLTVPNTFIATTEAITQAGGLPDFIDIDEDTYNMDLGKLREYLKTECEVDAKNSQTIHRKSKRRVSAILPVHLYGQMVDMDIILDIAKTYHLLVIEDACQAHGAEYYSEKENCWKKAGSMGCAAAFSFYAGKNLGAFGEGGAVTTNDEIIAKKIRMLRDHGQAKKYYHEIEGYNGRLDAIQAGILRIKLKQLAGWNENRRKNAERYNKLLGSLEDITLPKESPLTRSVYHLYVIRLKKRDDLLKHLSENNIGAGLHYPVPLHLQKAYTELGYGEGDFPVSENVAKEILSLPMHPHLTNDQQEYVAETVRSFVKG